MDQFDKLVVHLSLMEADSLRGCIPVGEETSLNTQTLPACIEYKME